MKKSILHISILMLLLMFSTKHTIGQVENNDTIVRYHYCIITDYKEIYFGKNEYLYQNEINTLKSIKSKKSIDVEVDEMNMMNEYGWELIFIYSETDILGKNVAKRVYRKKVNN